MRQLVVGLALVGAACGSSMGITYQGMSPQPLDLTLKCAAATADTLGYKPTFKNHGNTVEAIHKDSVLAPYEDGRQEVITITGQDSKKNEGSSSITVSRPQRSRSGPVSAPRPGPISTIASPGRGSMSATIRSITDASTRKCWPNRFLA